MTERLREELLRVGENVAPVHVPGDLWARGRRARRRDRLVSGGVVLSVVGLILVISMMGFPGLGARADVAPVSPSNEEGAVPSMLYGVPERLTSNEEAGTVWKSKVAETDLAIGRGSVAFGAGSAMYLPVVVTAVDGVQHPLVLPGWFGGTMAGFASESVPLAISPDGRNLAYGWFDPKSRADGAMPSGVRVVDLESGRIRTIPLQGGDGVAVETLVWSADSRWLVWRGTQTKRWTEERFGWQRNVAGRIGPGATSSRTVPVSKNMDQSIAVDNDGGVVIVGEGGWSVWHGRTIDVTSIHRAEGTTGRTRGIASVDADARTVVVGTPTPYDPSELIDLTTDLMLDIAPEWPHEEGAAVEPLGWLDGTTFVAFVTPAFDVEVDSGWRSREPELALITPAGASGSAANYRVVTHFVEGSFVKNISVAVDLMTLEQPTADFPPPDWPWSDERKALVVGLSVAALLGCLLLGRRWLRRSRRTLR